MIKSPVLALALGLGSLSLASGAAAQADPAPSIYATRQQTAILPSGRSINYLCTGVGSPTVILTAGMNDSTFVWHGVQPQMSETGRVCSWDRAGVGFSDASPEVQDTQHVEQDLEDWLAAADIAGPFIMVSHSMGSFETMVFAERQRSSVVGVVLVDPSYPGQMTEFAIASPRFFGETVPPMMAAEMENWRGCVRELSDNLPDKPFCDLIHQPGHPFYAPVEEVNQARMADAASLQNQLSLMEQFDGADAEQVARALTDFGDIPIIVLTADLSLPPDFADEMPAVRAAWTAMHDRYAGLSGRGVNRLVEGSEHYIFWTHPEAVIGAVSEIRGGATRP